MKILNSSLSHQGVNTIDNITQKPNPEPTETKRTCQPLANIKKTQAPRQINLDNQTSEGKELKEENIADKSENGSMTRASPDKQ